MSKPSQLAAAGAALPAIPPDALVMITTPSAGPGQPGQTVAIKLERLAGVVTPPDVADDVAAAEAARDAALAHADAAAQAHAGAVTAKEVVEQLQAETGTSREAAAGSAVDAAGAADAADQARAGALTARAAAEAAVAQADTARDAAITARDAAQAAKLAVDGKAGDVETTRAAAAAAATAAGTARDQAVAARNAAIAAAESAAGDAVSAIEDALAGEVQAAAAAASDADDAAAAAQAAAAASAAAATSAAGARDAAGTARDQASISATAAGTAKVGAETARDAAGTARTGAEAAANTAAAAKDAAIAARDAAATSKAGVDTVADQIAAARAAAAAARDQAIAAQENAGYEADRAEAAAMAAELAQTDAVGIRDTVLAVVEEAAGHRTAAAADRNAAEAARETSEDYSAGAATALANATDQASRAGVARVAAEVARADAVAARDLTIAARDVTTGARDQVIAASAEVRDSASTIFSVALAALLSGHLYISVAAGLAATPSGGQFWAINAGSLVYATNQAGTASVLITLAGALAAEQGLAAEQADRISADQAMSGRIDINDAAIARIDAAAILDRLRDLRVTFNGGAELDVEDEEVFYIRGGRAAAGVSKRGDLLGYGLDFAWGADLDRDHRLTIGVNEDDLATLAQNHDGTWFAVFDDDTKASLGGSVGALDVPTGLFDGDAFGAIYLNAKLTRVLSADEGPTYAYVYRRDVDPPGPTAAIREGREAFEGTIAFGQSLRVGGGALSNPNPSQNAVLTRTPLRRHLNLMLSDGIRGPMSTPWNKDTATDFAPAIDTFNEPFNVGETGLTGYMSYLSLRQLATGRAQNPLIARTDGKGGTPLAELIKGTIPYANALKSLRRMAEISCSAYGRPFVSRCVLFGHGNADRAGGTPRATYTAMLVQLAQDFNDDILALLVEFAAAYPELYAGVTLPTRIPMLSAQLTDAISSTGDSGDDIPFAFVDAAEQSSLIYISHPQYFYRGAYGYVDAAHLSPLGYDLQGEYDALAYERVVWNGEASPGLMPVRSGIQRDTAGRIVIPTIGRLGALRINTVDLPLAAAWGFTWSGAGSITGIAFEGDRILLSGTTGPGRLTYGNKHQAAAAPGGSYTYGNVSDTSPAESLVVPGRRNTNHLVAFDHQLA